MIKLVWKIENISVTQGSRILRNPLLLFENLHLLLSSNSKWGWGRDTDVGPLPSYLPFLQFTELHRYDTY